MYFTTEDEWAAAYSAATDEIRLAVASGIISCDPTQLTTVAVRIATAAIRQAQAVAAEDDIAHFPGVHVEHITIQRLPDRVA